MAKTGKKLILLNIRSPQAIELCINFAQKRAKGLRMSLDYAHERGLRIDVSGERDRIITFENEVRNFVDTGMPPERSNQQKYPNEHDFDDDEDAEIIDLDEDDLDKELGDEDEDLDDDEPSEDEDQPKSSKK